MYFKPDFRISCFYKIRKHSRLYPNRIIHPWHTAFKVTKSTLNHATNESAIHNFWECGPEGLVGFFEGWGIFRFQMGKQEKKLSKLTRQKRQLRPDLTPDMRNLCWRERNDAQVIVNHVPVSLSHPTPTSTNTSSLGTDALSRRGTVTHKSCSPLQTLFLHDWAQTHPHPSLLDTLKHKQWKQRRQTWQDRARDHFPPTHAHKRTHTNTAAPVAVFTPPSLNLNSLRFAFQGHCSSLSQAF